MNGRKGTLKGTVEGTVAGKVEGKVAGKVEGKLEGTLQRIGAALNAGDREAVRSFFTAEATLTLISDQDQITITGSGIGDAIDTLLTGFDDLKLTPTSRLLSEAGVVEETVVSGDHTGIFAGAEPTGRRVCVNARLSATSGPDLTLESLLVEVDTRALFVQIAEVNDVIGVTGRLNAIARERHDGALRITDQTHHPAAVASSDLGRRPHRRWIVAAALAMALLGATWLGTSTNGTPKAVTPAQGKPTDAAPSTVRKAPPIRKAPPARPALPVIAKADPKTVPKVQAGKQLVLKSDVLFAFDSAALTRAAIASVTRLANQVRATNVRGTIQINGYTDNLGSVGYGLALSRNRALAVAQILQRTLVGRQVTLVPQGFGQANPIAPNTSEAGRSRNRRVTIVLPAPR